MYIYIYNFKIYCMNSEKNHYILPFFEFEIENMRIFFVRWKKNNYTYFNIQHI